MVKAFAFKHSNNLICQSLSKHLL